MYWFTNLVFDKGYFCSSISLRKESVEKILIEWSTFIKYSNGSNSFRPQKQNGVIFFPEAPCISVIGALMYLVNAIRLDIAFSVNLLTRHNSSPAKSHRNEIKYILRYLKRTIVMNLFCLIIAISISLIMPI